MGMTPALRTIHASSALLRPRLYRQRPTRIAVGIGRRSIDDPRCHLAFTGGQGQQPQAGTRFDRARWRQWQRWRLQWRDCRSAARHQ